MTTPNPFLDQHEPRQTAGDFTKDEVRLANRNSGIPLEALRYDITPIGLHYLLSHFDIPDADPSTWEIAVGGLVDTPARLTLRHIQALPARTCAVTLECAGNGRGHVTPRYISMPWLNEAVGTAQWTGVPLRDVLAGIKIKKQATHIAFLGADRGFDRTGEHFFGRSLPLDLALRGDVLVCTVMNGQPLLPQHGFPVRLIVPGWYGMASVKWLNRIDLLDRPFDGPQQARGYHYRQTGDETGVPITTMRVKSLMIPPGVPDWLTRQRVVDAGRVIVRGRAWSGGGVPISRVAFGIDGIWHDALVDPAQTSPASRFAWRGWQYLWDAVPGIHELTCRATDAEGAMQPVDPVWDAAGFGNNGVHHVRVVVR